MKKKYIWLIAIAALLIGLHIALPFLIKNRLNKALNNIDGYSGHVDRVGVNLFRGGMQVYELFIYEKASLDTTIPIVDLQKLDFSLEWKSLFKGRFVGEAYLDSLIVNFTRRNDAALEDTTKGRDYLLEQIRQLNPITLNVFEIRGGEIAFKDPSSKPEIDVRLRRIWLRAENIGNVEDPNNKLPGALKIDADGGNQGVFKLRSDVNVLKEIPEFDLDFELVGMDITKFNDVLESRAGFDLQAGRLSLYTELQHIDGKIEGYVKPIITDLQVTGRDTSEGILRKAYEGVVQLGSNILENNKEDQIATELPISGTIETAGTQTWTAIWNLFENAFIDAYKRQLNYTLSFPGGNVDSKEAKKAKRKEKKEKKKEKS